MSSSNHISPAGLTAAVGTFAAGTELILRLHVNNTGNDFYSGNPSRNVDGLPHARVQDNWTPGATRASFEDLLNTPEGVNSFNDPSCSFSNTRGVDPVPEALTVGVAGVSAIRRKLSR